MRERPALLTAIRWFLIGADGVVLFAALVDRHPSPHSVLRMEGPGWKWNLALAVAGMIVRLIAGLGALRGWNWSRFVYGAWMLALTALWLAASAYPQRALPLVGEFVALLILACLFTPPANRWYRREAPRAGELTDVFW